MSADVFKYFDDAHYLFQKTQGELFLRWKIILGLYNENSIDIKEILQGTKFWDSRSEVLFNDNRSMIRLHLILYHLSNGVYLLHTLFFAFFSFIGGMGLFKFFVCYTHIKKLALYSFVFFVPSILFWTSAPLKESFLMLGLGLSLFGIARFEQKASKHSPLIVLFGIIFLMSLKLYILSALIPGILFLFLSQRLPEKRVLLIFIGIHILTVMVILVFSDNIINILAQKQLVFKNLLENTTANSTIKIKSFSTLSELLFIIPEALYNVLVHPSFPPNWNLLSLFAATENTVFLLITLFPFFFFKPPSMREKRIALFSLSFLFLSATIIGLTTPVIGAIVRYKTPLIPFYLILIFTFVDFTKLRLRPQ